MQTRCVDMTSEVRGEHFGVQVESEVCDHCGFRVLTDAQADAYALAGTTEYRLRHGLLTSDEIRDSRRRLGKMSQRDFAKYLGVGEASVKRWEAGHIQDESSDRLIRMKTDLHAAKENVRRIGAFLREASGVERSLVR